MDNCPRFDGAVILDAPDFSAYQAHDMACLAKIAEALDLPDRARLWCERSQAMSQAIQAHLWNPAKQFYCDRDMDGSFIPVRAVSGFMPLLLESSTSARRRIGTGAARSDGVQRTMSHPFGGAG